MIASKNNLIRIFTLIVAAALVFAGCGSGNKNVQKPESYQSPGESESIDGVVAENDKYQLLYDSAQALVSVYDKSDGSVFSTTKPEEQTELDEFGLPKMQDARMLSDIIVEYQKPETAENNVLYSNVDAVSAGSVTTEGIENGLRVTFYFESAEIAIPVDYVLTNEGFSVSVDPTKIKENKNKTVSVSVAPFACAVKNDAEDAYLFIPSGSGSLVYPRNVSATGSTYFQSVYGNDPLDVVWEKDSNEQTVKLPVYGVKDGNNGLCAIISSGDDSAAIEAIYGSSSIGSSTVYSTFNVRGRVRIRKTLYGTRTKEVTQYSENFIETPCKVDFYILKGNDANYSGMARLFREKALKDSGTETANSAMNLVIYGGAMIDKSFLGIPYKSVFATTTLEEAYQMVKELKEETGASVSVLLKGFGKTGIDIGEIGGGYTLSGAVGSRSELNELGAYCEENNIGNYFDFDVVRQSASGLFSSGDTARSIDKQTEYQYLFDKAVNSRITDTRYTLISRSSLTGCVDKLISKTAKWNIGGIALDTLSNISYSDYDGLKYPSKTQMSTDVSNIFTKLKESGKEVASVSANFYAANNSDAIFETPSSSNKSNGLSVDVPFYQMVFKGKADIGCESVNFALDERDAILKSVESGAGITYALYNNYNTALTDSYYPVFSTGTYSMIKQGIVDQVKALKGYYDSIENSSVKEHILISNDVRKTVFENGTVAYVNYSDNDYKGDFGTVAAHGYLIVPSAAE
ncbi:MAG: DUF5696 domain-containing protein [Acutalibacteraceae bacterium]|nr:DUF5696 domain-containing protein [Acutalibacteraceae bacterium]